MHTHTHSAPSPPGPLHKRLWPCGDGWDELRSCPIKLGVYWGQMASTHTQQQRSAPLFIRDEGFRLLAPYIRQDMQGGDRLLWQLILNCARSFSSPVLTLSAHLLLRQDSSNVRFTQKSTGTSGTYNTSTCGTRRPAPLQWMKLD